MAWQNNETTIICNLSQGLHGSCSQIILVINGLVFAKHALLLDHEISQKPTILTGSKFKGCLKSIFEKLPTKEKREQPCHVHKEFFLPQSVTNFKSGVDHFAYPGDFGWLGAASAKWTDAAWEVRDPIVSCLYIFKHRILISWGIATQVPRMGIHAISKAANGGTQPTRLPMSALSGSGKVKYVQVGSAYGLPGAYPRRILQCQPVTFAAFTGTHVMYHFSAAVCWANVTRIKGTDGSWWRSIWRIPTCWSFFLSPQWRASLFSCLQSFAHILTNLSKQETNPLTVNIYMFVCLQVCIYVFYPFDWCLYNYATQWMGGGGHKNILPRNMNRSGFMSTVAIM